MLDLIQQWTQNLANLTNPAQFAIGSIFGIAFLLVALFPTRRVDAEPDWLAGDFIPPAHTAHLARREGEAGGGKTVIGWPDSRSHGEGI